MEYIVEMKQVSKVFKDKRAVDDISFRIAKGSITAILGPNGAGKTTSLSMMLGLMEPTNGIVSLFGQPPASPETRVKIGAMLQEVSVMDKLKVKEIIALFRSYYPNPMAEEKLYALTGLAAGDLNRYAEKLSGGQKRSLGFALALAGDPELLFFDEPTVGLDVTARKKFWDQVRQLAAQGKTVVFTTHYLQEAEDIADRVLLFNRGALAADGSPEQIKARLLKRSVSCIPLEGFHALRSRLGGLPGVTQCELKDGRAYIMSEDTDKTLAALFIEGYPVRDVQTHQGRLEEAFEQLITEQEGA